MRMNQDIVCSSSITTRIDADGAHPSVHEGTHRVVYAFAVPENERRDNVVMPTNVLQRWEHHKYSFVDDAPSFPEAMATRRKSRFYPQRTAELMAGPTP